MIRFLFFYKKTLGKLFVFLAISCIISGCNEDNESVPASKTKTKREASSHSAGKLGQNCSETKTRTGSAALDSKQNIIPSSTVKHAASGTILPDNKNPANAIVISSNNRIRRFETYERDPFALPEELRVQHPSPREQRQTSRQFQQGYSQSDSAGNRSVYGYCISSDSKAFTDRNGQQSTTGMPRSVPPFSPEPCVAGIFDNGKDKFALVRWQQVQGIFHTGEALGNGYYVKEITAVSVYLCPEQTSSGKGILILTLK